MSDGKSGDNLEASLLLLSQLLASFLQLLVSLLSCLFRLSFAASFVEEELLSPLL